MSWIEQSLMARKGVARGKEGARHTITIEDQGKFHYVYGPYVDPVLTVAPGAVVTVETHDAFEGKITSESDKPSTILNFPFLNPQTGPIAVEGAEKGDCLAVHIRSIKPRGPQPVGTTCLLPEFGGLVGTGQTALLNAPLPEKVKKLRVDENGVYWSRQDHAALRALHRHDRHQPRDRGDQLAAAGLLRRQHGPAGRGARGRSSTCR